MNKQEISKLQIDLSKVNAIGQKYFDLFDKHIPVDISGNILIYDISNADCIVNIIRKNPNAKYFVYGNSFVNEAIKCINEWNITFLDETFDLYNIDMKFDCIVMNPPYSRNLHLKILAEAIKHLKDEKSVCVNLSPIRWLQDPIAKFRKTTDFKRFEQSISKHLISVDIIRSTQANELFNIANFSDLAIYSCNCNKGTFDYNSICDIRYDVNIKWLNRVFKKILEIDGYNNLNILKYNSSLQHFVLINRMAPPMKYGKPMFDALKRYCKFFTNGKNEFNQTYEQAKIACPRIVNGNIENDEAVVFNTAIEAKNCYNSLMNTVFCRFVCMMSVTDVNMHQEFLPWMNKCINPRTGLKGYEGEWTDDDFYKFFNITPEEQKIIEETMAKYK